MGNARKVNSTPQLTTPLVDHRAAIIQDVPSGLGIFFKRSLLTGNS